MNKNFSNQKGKAVVIILLIIAVIIIVLAVKSKKTGEGDVAPATGEIPSAATNGIEPSAEPGNSEEPKNNTGDAASGNEATPPEDKAEAKTEIQRLQKELAEIAEEIKTGKDLDLSELEGGGEITDKMKGF